MPPLVFYIGVGGIIFLLIAYAIMELARPWPSHAKEREEKRYQQKVDKRHAELQEVLDEAAATDALNKKLESEEPILEESTEDLPTNTEQLNEMSEEDTSENFDDDSDISDLEEVEEPDDLVKTDS